MSWSEAWEEGRTPWDAGESAPALRRLVDEQRLPQGRALVPGCGSGYDVATLASANRRVVGLDLASGAAERCESVRREAGVSASWVEFVVDDFFTFAPGEPFDLVWDYTFLCAIEPGRRREWARRMGQLLRPGGMLATLIFPVAPAGEGPESGPPYRLTPAAVWELVDGAFETVELRPAHVSLPERRGMEWVGMFRKA